jgi:cytochrome c oxidase subunit 2
VKRSRAPLWFAVVLAVIGIMWLYRTLVMPLTPQTTVYPLTEFGESTQRVYGFTNWLMLAIFFAIEGWLVYTAMRFQVRSQELPVQTHGRRSLEVGFTLATTVLVMVLFVPSCQEIGRVQAAAPEGAIQVDVTGRQWWWEFYYPEQDVVTANELVLPAGRTANFRVTSSDVIHAFWFPRMGGKRDAVPGRTFQMWFTPPEAGVYEGQCAEFCGTSHANMLMHLRVVPPAEFDAWVAGQKAATPPAADPLAAQGQVAFLAEGGCVTCHSPFQNDGSVRGLQGPNLRKIGTRGWIAAGMLENTPENMFRWIKNPHALKPGSLMRVVNPHTAKCTGPGEPDACCIDALTGNCLPDPTIEQIVAYLQSLD